MEKMAGMLADRFYEKSTFPTVSYEAFKYVIEFTLEMAAGILASAIIAVCFNMRWETAAFLLIFWVLRSYAGGIHLDKFSHCFLFSAFVIAGTMALVKYSYVPLWFSHLLFVGGVGAFMLTEPESDRNRTVDEEEDAYFKKKLRQSFFTIAVIYLFCAFTQNRKYTFLIAITVSVVYVLMILGKVKNAKNN